MRSMGRVGGFKVGGWGAGLTWLAIAFTAAQFADLLTSLVVAHELNPVAKGVAAEPMLQPLVEPAHSDRVRPAVRDENASGRHVDGHCGTSSRIRPRSKTDRPLAEALGGVDEVHEREHRGCAQHDSGGLKRGRPA